MAFDPKKRDHSNSKLVENTLLTSTNKPDFAYNYLYYWEKEEMHLRNFTRFQVAIPSHESRGWGWRRGAVHTCTCLNSWLLLKLILLPPKSLKCKTHPLSLFVQHGSFPFKVSYKLLLWRQEGQSPTSCQLPFERQTAPSQESWSKSSSKWRSGEAQL